MMMNDWTVQDAISKRDHFIALGQTDIWLHSKDESDRPWDKVNRVESGSSYRLSLPTGARLSAEVDGLTFIWSVDFEGRDANGRGVSVFDRDRVRDIFGRLPPGARLQFQELLKNEVLPKMMEHTAEIRAVLNAQADSEDCVRGVIAWAEGPSP